MPRALKSCPVTGCPNLTRGGRCAEHEAERKRIVDAGRPTAAQRGYTSARWRSTRRAQLRREPLCRECGKVATDVDHIDGLGPLGPRGHDPENLQSLCRPCHSRKTARENGGFGR